MVSKEIYYYIQYPNNKLKNKNHGESEEVLSPERRHRIQNEVYCRTYQDAYNQKIEWALNDLVYPNNSNKDDDQKLVNHTVKNI